MMPGGGLLHEDHVCLPQVVVQIKTLFLYFIGLHTGTVQFGNDWMEKEKKKKNQRTAKTGGGYRASPFS